MSGLDIDSLRLTEDEKNVGGLYSIHSQQRDYVADAQLAKALRGVYDWMASIDHPQSDLMAEAFLGWLEQANIKRPAAETKEAV